MQAGTGTRYGRILAATLAVAALVLTVRRLPADRWLLDLVSWIRGAGWAGMLVFALAYVLACVLFLPGSILTLVAGFAYCVATGSPLVWLSANLGATLAFLLGRTLARGWVAARVARNPRFAAIDRAVAQQGLRIVLLTRLSPVFPFNLLNYAFGLTRVSLRDYVLAVVAGLTPRAFAYTFFGDSLHHVGSRQFIAAIAVLGLLVIVPLAFRWHWFGRGKGVS